MLTLLGVTELIFCLTWQSNNLEALTAVSHTVNMVLLCLHVQSHRHQRSG